jgi:hypothetical protein
VTSAELHARLKGRPCTRCGRAPHAPTRSHAYTPVVLDRDRRAARRAGRQYLAAKRAAWGCSGDGAA